MKNINIIKEYNNLSESPETEVVRVSNYNNKYEGYINDWHIKGFRENKIKSYFNRINNDEIMKSLSKDISNLDEQIKETLKKKLILENELNMIKQAEEVKKKNKEIEEYIDTLTNENKLNTWNNYTDYKEYSSIRNGTYQFEIGYKLGKSWRTDEERYEINYTFSTSDILPQNLIIQSVETNIADKEKAMKYIEGRKKHFSKYFTEEKPAILQKFKQSIKLHGITLEGYSVEEE